MNPESRNEYVKYRLESAYKTFDAARVLADNEYWNSAINRLYYSVFLEYKKEDVEPLFEPAEEMISVIDHMIKASL